MKTDKNEVEQGMEEKHGYGIFILTRYSASLYQCPRGQRTIISTGLTMEYDGSNEFDRNSVLALNLTEPQRLR